MGQWGYDLTMLIMGIVSFALALWLLRVSQGAKRRGRGLRVITLGIFLQGGGLVLASATVLEYLGRASWEPMALGFLFGSVLGLWASTNRIKKWERALQTEGTLPRREEKWWTSGRFMLALFLVVSIVALWLPPDLLVLPRATGLLVALFLGVPGLFIAYGLSLSTWARRKEKEGLGPMVIPAP